MVKVLCVYVLDQEQKIKLIRNGVTVNINERAHMYTVAIVSDSDVGLQIEETIRSIKDDNNNITTSLIVIYCNHEHLHNKQLFLSTINDVKKRRNKT